MLYNTALCPESSGPPFVTLKCSNFAVGHSHFSHLSSTRGGPNYWVCKFIKRKTDDANYNVFPSVHGCQISYLFLLRVSGGETEASERERNGPKPVK